LDIKDFLKERGLTEEFTLAVLDEVSEIPDLIEEREIARRRNLFDKVVVTIDGEDAKDLDDAISIEKNSDGTYQLGVHIADVSFYVKENSMLDLEALNRGTSTYLVDTVVPMLPKKLSNGLCSLNPYKPRLTLSVFMDINKYGAVMNYEICESVIKSTARMTYKKVTQILDGDMAARNEYDDFIPVFETMRELALILRDKRSRRGSIDFDFPEPKIITDAEGKVKEIKTYEITISNKIIEEFMLLANETVAKHMSLLGLPSVYRVHESPDKAKIEKLAELVHSMGHKLKVKNDISPKAMQNLLFKINETPQYVVLSTIMLRSMMKARYCEENLGHFGLAADYYCHFTSPIRRYPDLMVHRLLREWLNGNLDDKKIQQYQTITRDVALQSSETEMSATVNERDFVDYKMCEYMEDKIGLEYDGIISSITSFGMFVQLPSTIEGLVRMVDLEDDYYEFDEVHYTLIGRRTGRMYNIGDSIKVRLVKVNTELKQIDFQPVENVMNNKKGKSFGKEKTGKKEVKNGARKTSKSKQKGGKKGSRSK